MVEWGGGFGMLDLVPVLGGHVRSVALYRILGQDGSGVKEGPELSECVRITNPALKESCSLRIR